MSVSSEIIPLSELAREVGQSVGWVRDRLASGRSVAGFGPSRTVDRFGFILGVRRYASEKSALSAEVERPGGTTESVDVEVGTAGDGGDVPQRVNGGRDGEPNWIARVFRWSLVSAVAVALFGLARSGALTELGWALEDRRRRQLPEMGSGVI